MADAIRAEISAFKDVASNFTSEIDTMIAESGLTSVCRDSARFFKMHKAKIADLNGRVSELPALKSEVQSYAKQVAIAEKTLFKREALAASADVSQASFPSGSNACACTATNAALDFLERPDAPFDSARAMNVTRDGVDQYRHITRACRNKDITMQRGQNLDWGVDAKPFYSIIENDIVFLAVDDIQAAFDDTGTKGVYRSTLQKLANDPRFGANSRTSCVAQIGGYYFSILMVKNATGNPSFRLFDSHMTIIHTGSIYSKELPLEKMVELLHTNYPRHARGLELTPIERMEATGAGSARFDAARVNDADFAKIRARHASDRRSVRRVVKKPSDIIEKTPKSEGFITGLKEVNKLVDNRSDPEPFGPHLRPLIADSTDVQILGGALGLFDDKSKPRFDTRINVLMWREVIQECSKPSEDRLNAEQISHKVRGWFSSIGGREKVSGHKGNIAIAKTIQAYDHKAFAKAFPKISDDAMTHIRTRVKGIKPLDFKHQVAACAEFLAMEGILKPDELTKIQKHYSKYFAALN